MNNLKTNPIGLDAVIDKVQKKLYNKLTVLWNVPIEAYPRCYVLEKDKVRTIEHFKSNKEYSGNLIYAEANKFFFTSENDIEKENELNFTHYKTDVDLYFIVNVPKIKTSLTHRGDEEIRNDVMFILDNMGDVSIKKVVKNIEKVFNGFEHQSADDLQPYHCFKITLTINNFRVNQTNCT